MKNLLLLIVILLILSGCAAGRLHIIDANGKIVGECTAGYEWHPYGVEDSVDWLLNYCAQGALADNCDNCSVSDESIIKKDYSFPEPPDGNTWNKVLAWQEFTADRISERKYGYILAYIENVYYRETEEADRQLKEGLINKTEHEQLIEKAEFKFRGK